MNYKNISTEFQPLDLILFSGTDFVSNGIKFIEKIANGQGDFSHVGLLINSEIASTSLNNTAIISAVNPFSKRHCLMRNCNGMFEIDGKS